MEHTPFTTILDYDFQNSHLLHLALTHSSWSNEHHVEEHNERVEFLGDSVLELCVSRFLYDRFPQAREGDLTRLRSALVNTRMLANVARHIGLDIVLQLGRGEEQQGGRQRDALLADALEAVLGAVFLDGGFEAAWTVVDRLFTGQWPKQIESSSARDFKSRLQEVTQRLLRSLPVYVLLDSEGPEHDKRFTVRVAVSDGRFWIGTASSMKRAEHKAARQALEALERGASEISD